MLVVELDGAGDGLGQGEAGGGGDGPGQLLPQGLGHVLGHQGVLGLDLGEWVRHGGRSIISGRSDLYIICNRKGKYFNMNCQHK